MTLNYYLDKPKSEGDTAIYLYLRIGVHTVKIKTGQHINPRHWNPKPDKNGNHIKRSYTGALEFNGWLSGFKGDIHQLYNEFTSTHSSASIQELKEEINQFQNKKELTADSGFFGHFQNFIDICSTERSKATIAKYRVVRKHLENFCKAQRYNLSFESVNLHFFDLFKTYLIKELKHTDNTLWKDFSIVKTFMNWTLDRRLHQSLHYKKFKAPQRDAESIYLTERELMALYSFKLPRGSYFSAPRAVLS